MKDNLKWLLIPASVIVLIIILLALLIFLFKGYINSNRYGKDVSFVDCFDIFSIEHESPALGNKRYSLYNIRDDKHDYIISIIDTLKHYKISNGMMYIYEPLIFPVDQYYTEKYGDKPWQYPQKYFMNSQVIEINYRSPQEFPNYIQVEISTGEVTLYNTYDEISEEVKGIFRELEDDYNKRNE